MQAVPTVKGDLNRAMDEELFSPEMSKLLKDRLGATGSGEDAISLYIWDFAGHEMYYTTHQVRRGCHT